MNKRSLTDNETEAKDSQDNAQTLGEKSSKSPKDKNRPKSTHEDRWNKWYDLLQNYFKEHGHCNMPTSYRCPGTGEALGNWVDYQRKLLKSGRLAPSREAKISTLLGQTKHKNDVDAAMARLLAQQKKKQNAIISPAADVLQGYSVGVIPSVIKTALGEQKTRSSVESKGKQKGAGTAAGGGGGGAADAEARWNSAYNDLLIFAQEYGHCNVPQDYRTSAGRCLGKWLDFQRQMKKRDRLRADREEQLQMLVRSGHLNMYTGPRRGHRLSLENVAQWDEWFEALLAYGEANGHYNVPRKYSIPSNGRRLGRWLQNQRQHKRRGDMRPERFIKLQELVDKGLLKWYDDSDEGSVSKGDGGSSLGDDGKFGSDGDDDSALSSNESESESVDDAAAVLHTLSSNQHLTSQGGNNLALGSFSSSVPAAKRQKKSNKNNNGSNSSSTSISAADVISSTAAHCPPQHTVQNSNNVSVSAASMQQTNQGMNNQAQPHHQHRVINDGRAYAAIIEQLQGFRVLPAGTTYNPSMSAAAVARLIPVGNLQPNANANGLNPTIYPVNGSQQQTLYPTAHHALYSNHSQSHSHSNGSATAAGFMSQMRSQSQSQLLQSDSDFLSSDDGRNSLGSSIAHNGLRALLLAAKEPDFHAGGGNPGSSYQ